MKSSIFGITIDKASTVSDGISIIADFPRFLVLLLAFQRFTVEDWGIVPVLNPAALIHLGIEQDPDSNVRDELCPPVDEIRLPLAGDHFAGPSSAIHVRFGSWGRISDY